MNTVAMTFCILSIFTGILTFGVTLAYLPGLIAGQYLILGLMFVLAGVYFLARGTAIDESKKQIKDFQTAVTGLNNAVDDANNKLKEVN